MGDLVSDRELQGVIFVFADQVEEAPIDIDISAGVRESVDFVTVHDRRIVGDLFAIARREKRLGGLFDTRCRQGPSAATGLSEQSSREARRRACARPLH